MTRCRLSGNYLLCKIREGTTPEEIKKEIELTRFIQEEREKAKATFPPTVKRISPDQKLAEEIEYVIDAYSIYKQKSDEEALKYLSEKAKCFGLRLE